MTVYYYTKYWESIGIQIVTTDEKPDDLGLIYIRGDICAGNAGYCLHLDKDTFRTLGAARADVVSKHQKAIKSAENKLKKLRDIDPHTMSPRKLAPYKEPA